MLPFSWTLVHPGDDALLRAADKHRAQGGETCQCPPIYNGRVPLPDKMLSKSRRAARAAAVLLGVPVAAVALTPVVRLRTRL
jgi:hypothetical protein